MVQKLKNLITKYFTLVVYYDTKISEIEKNVFNTSDYNTFTSDILDAMIKGKKLVDQTAKAELKAQQNKILQLQVFDFFLMIVFKICLLINQHLIN